LLGIEVVWILTSNGREIGKTGLMLVEDPEDTMKTMCQFRDTTLDLYRFKTTYEEIKQRSTPIHEKHAHTHFYTLSLYGLIVPSESGPKGVYRISPIGKEICDCLERSDAKKLRQILSSILLNNPRKGQLFKDFLKFVSERPKVLKKEIYTQFKALPGRTLIAWSKAAGLIESDKDFVWSLPREKKIVTLEQFKEKLVEAYKEINKPQMLGVEKIFVEISELRQRICVDFSWSLKEFDEYLTRLLDSPFGEKIRLYGGPSSVFEESKNFMYGDRLYIYIRIKV
jgi:hypothetical protein